MILEGDRKIVGGKNGSSTLVTIDPDWVRGNQLKSGDKISYIGDYNVLVYFKSDLTSKDKIIKFVESMGGK